MNDTNHSNNGDKTMTTTTAAQDVKIGDFVLGSYKYGCISGKILSLNSRVAVIQVYNQNYDNYTKTDEVTNLTISRIRSVNPNDANLID